MTSPTHLRALFPIPIYVASWGLRALCLLSLYVLAVLTSMVILSGFFGMAAFTVFRDRWMFGMLCVTAALVAMRAALRALGALCEILLEMWQAARERRW